VTDDEETKETTRKVPLLPPVAAFEIVMYWPTTPAVRFAKPVNVCTLLANAETVAAVPVWLAFVVPEDCPLLLAMYLHPAASIVRVSFQAPWKNSPEFRRTRFAESAFAIGVSQKEGVVTPS
jgi:hypothetical protein